MTLPYGGSLGMIFPFCIAGIVWAYFNYKQVSKIIVRPRGGEQELQQGLKLEESEEHLALLCELGSKIYQGAMAFLKEEYLFCLIFITVGAFLLIFIVSGYCAVAFFIGGCSSMLCGYIGMMIATYANYRVSFKAITSLSEAFQVAYRSGTVMGFCLVSISLFILNIVIIIFYNMHVDPESPTFISDLTELFDYIAGYGLGGSTVALFGRVGGGIYTKAADVGADLVGKLEKNLPEDSPKNPATIADNVGDNVGDIAGMGADLFGSFAESTCAALVVSAALLKYQKEGTTELVTSLNVLMYPLLQSAWGIVICIAVSYIGIYVTKVQIIQQIEKTLKYQLILSTIFLSPFFFAVAYWVLPDTFYLTIKTNTVNELGLPEQLNPRHPFHASLCSLIGLWAGLAIGYFTEYMTSHTYEPVREVARACHTGAATNIIYGLALGYFSTIVPVICIALTGYFSAKMLSFYGVALAALGMLSNLTIGLAIDGYGPIADNAGGIAEMAELGHQVRERTDALDAVGNTTAAIGKGFAIGSAALVSLALYGGFVTRSTYPAKGTALYDTSIMDPLVYMMLIIGAMLPYAFSAFTMKSVGRAALEMVKEIRRQLREDPGICEGTSEPDFQACIRISTRASLREMVAPGLLVIVTPIMVGIFFGPEGIAGLLPGSLISGVQLAISASNTGGAWDNAKKFIESGQYIDEDGNVKKKGSDEHKAAVIGDTVGDPLKDTSGPSLNILIKLMAILSLVLAQFFCSTDYL